MVAAEFYQNARRAQLFGDRWHFYYLVQLTRAWQSWKVPEMGLLPKSRLWRTITIVLGSLIFLVAFFYAEEDLRGWLAWENCKREYETKGYVLDWDKLIPPPVPDDQNFFKAPKMTDWFVKPPQGSSATNELTARLGDKKHGVITASVSRTTNMIETADAAMDYLTWSDQFKPDFNLIREALKRPYARMDGDYRNPSEGPIPNFVAYRAVVQMLAQRAHCYLLLGEPEQALQELTLLHETRQMLEAAPTHKPMTLVAAMINVAGAGLHTDIIAEGIKRHEWEEPQLVALQKQLPGKKLTQFVLDGLEREPVGSSRTFEIAAQNDGMRKTLFGPWRGNDLKHSLFWLLVIAPRGWVYQNMVINSDLQLKFLNAQFDPTNDIISPREVDKFSPAIDAFVGSARHSPFRILAAIAIPNFTRAWQTTAHNQTMVNEAQIACALERYRLAHGEYPETLDALAPQFIEKLPHDIIGGQPLHYRRMDDGKFLLYSVGWNETDDGGQTAFNKNGTSDWENGDWVWKN